MRKFGLLPNSTYNDFI